MNKKIIYILLFVVSILSLLVGCGKDKKEESMQINLTTVTMSIGDVVKLEVSNASSEVSYSSSDDSVATVKNGEITAIAAGSATITVNDDNDTCNCVVTVLAPEFDGVNIIAVDSKLVELIIGDEYQLSPKLLRGTDVVNGVQFNYTSMDETVAVVENGKIKAISAGETYVQIDAVNYEKTSQTVKVVVSNDFTIDLSQGVLTLSKMEILEYTTSKSFPNVSYTLTQFVASTSKL